MQKRGKDKHFTERGIITQPFTGVIIGLQAVGLFTDEQQGFRGASKPSTDTHTHTKKVLPATELSLAKFSLSGIRLRLRFLSRNP